MMYDVTSGVLKLIGTRSDAFYSCGEKTIQKNSKNFFNFIQKIKLKSKKKSISFMKINI